MGDDQLRPDQGRLSPRRRPPAMGKPHVASLRRPALPATPHPRSRPREGATPSRRSLPAPWVPWSGLAPTHRASVLARDALRNFLRAVPREEADAIFQAPGEDGQACTITRAELSQLIDTQLHSRRRQVVRLGVEERWARDRVCRYLKGISAKTYERDQQEALDTLLAAIYVGGAVGERGRGGQHA